MICAIIQNVIVRNNLLLLLDNFNWKVVALKLQGKKTFKGTEKRWKNFIKPGLNIATPIISAGVAAKTKNPQSAQITSNVLKSLKGGKMLSLTDIHGRGLRLKVM